MTDGRFENVVGAVALGLSDGLLRASQRGAPESCPSAAIALAGHIPGLSIKQLSRALRLSHPAAVRLVDRLVDHGLIVREKSEDDGRTVALFLTIRGKEVYASVLGARRSYLKGVLEVLSAEERALYLDLNSKILSRMISGEEQALSVCRLCEVEACVDCPVEEMVTLIQQNG